VVGASGRLWRSALVSFESENRRAVLRNDLPMPASSSAALIYAI